MKIYRLMLKVSMFICFLLIISNQSFARDINLAHVLSSNHPCGIGLKKFANQVNKDTNGEITIKIHDSGILGGEMDTINQLQTGSLDMMLSYSVSIMQGMEPLLASEELPFLWATKKEAYDAFDGELGDLYTKLIEKHDIKVLCYWENGFRNFTNNERPINIPKDMKGLKFRSAQSAIRVDFFETVGASAIPMPFPELFTGLQQGTVDGQENPLVIIDSSKFYEVQNYCSLSGHIWNSAVLLVNPNTWDNLSKENQDIIIKNSLKYRDYTRDLINERNKELIEKFESEGMEVNEVDKEAFTKAVSPLWEKYFDKWSDIDKGPQLIKILREKSSMVE